MIPIRGWKFCYVAHTQCFVFVERTHTFRVLTAGCIIAELATVLIWQFFHHFLKFSLFVDFDRFCVAFWHNHPFRCYFSSTLFDFFFFFAAFLAKSASFKACSSAAFLSSSETIRSFLRFSASSSVSSSTGLVSSSVKM